MKDTVTQRRHEFFENVWDHSSDSFQKQFDERLPLTAGEIDFFAFYY